MYILKRINFFLIFLFIQNAFSQSDLEKTIKAGEILVNGLSFFKSNKSDQANNSKTIENVCVKNKLTDKITFNLTGKDEEGNTIKKDLVIPKDGKECLLELPKGIYTYEIVLPNNEVFKKGEYKFIEETTIIVKSN